MALMLTGKPIKPKKALAIGLIDRISTPQSWKADATELVLGRPQSASVPVADQLLAWKPVRPLLARTLRAQVRRKAKPEHYPAPYAIIDLWQNHYASATAQDAEARSFAKLVFSPTSQNLLRVFFLQERLKDLAKVADVQFKHVHVVGAGTMGADIAAWCAIRGMNVTLQDREKRYVDAGLERAASVFERKLKQPELIENAKSRLVADTTGEGARAADLIIEAIFEDLDAKQALFRELEKRARPDALLATNTSSIPLKQIATALSAPTRLIGLHFFNPVALMPLVEVVHTPTTLRAAVDTGCAFVKQIGKLPLPCKGLPGFLVNRILAPYMDEAFRLHAEGIPAEAIDKAAMDFGMPMGPLELADTVGLDILQHVATILSDTIKRDVPAGLAELVQEERLGQKNGHGFYKWEDGKHAKDKGNVEYDPVIQQRLILSLVNEAVACIADKVEADGDLVDAGTIFGAGFAPFRGGPIQYAQQSGLGTIQGQLEELQERFGERFKLSAGWGKIDSKSTKA